MIYGICGSIGSGKSYYQFAFALNLANQRCKRIVTNFRIDIPALKKYASRRGLHWVTYLCDNGLIATIDTLENLTDLLQYPNSVVCLDEAGIFLNAREYAKTPREFLIDLCQSRKDGIDLIYAAQFDGQVDKQFRQLTQYFVHAFGLSKFDKKMRRPRLIWTCYFTFTDDQYWAWTGNFKARANFFKSWFAATKTEFGPFTPKRAELFGCFGSFDRLDKQSSNARGFSPPPQLEVYQSYPRYARLARRRSLHYRRMKTDLTYLLNADLREVFRFLRYYRHV